MNIVVPDISKQIYANDTLKVLENRYSTLGSLWVNHQMEWCNGIYATFKDHDKFLIIIYLIKKTLDFYSRNFTKFSYDEFYNKDTVVIEKYNISEISLALNIPKESARRKIQELEKIGAIKRSKNQTMVDRSSFYYSKPINSVKRISRFLSLFSEMCCDEKILSKQLTSEQIETVIKNNFSYVWKIYYELQIPMLINYKKIFTDIETFHIFGTCVANQHLYARKMSEDYMDRDDFIKSTFTAKKMQGVNAMSISDITGIPRATVIRKLKKLVKKNNLKIDNKKQYKLTSAFTKKLMPLQKNVLIRLADFSARIYNLAIL